MCYSTLTIYILKIGKTMNTTRQVMKKSTNFIVKFSFVVSILLLMSTTSQAETANDKIKTMTVEDVFANKGSLKGKQIQVKGKVVKVSQNIMKLQWIHIEDGTGNKENGTNKIIFRSKKQVVPLGSEVIATGTVDTDLDFGYGYSYSVLVNEATFKQ